MNATNASNALKAPNEVSAGFSIARFLRSILREYLVVVAIVWLVLITVALFLQRGLWGLVERGYDLAFRRGAHTDTSPDTPAEEH